ncbi:MAG: ESX secretion-associated protein EspG [Sciscionella sp.]|nr:ESX secretion-associated protein EspG [Sciscionella sp.]
MLPKSFSVPVDVLDRIVRMEKLGELNIALAPTPMYYPEQLNNARNREAMAHFDKLGFVGRRGLDDEVAAALSALCRAHTEYFGWHFGGGDDGRVGVFAGSLGRDAVLAIRTKSTIELRPISPDQLAESLAQALPYARPGRGQTVSIRKTDLDASNGEHSVSGGLALREMSGKQAAQLNVIRQLRQLPSTACGELHAGIRDRVGRHAETEFPLRYIDTTNGRWLSAYTTSSGEPWLIFTPGSPQELSARLHELRGTLRL